jgi:hypothetical protein
MKHNVMLTIASLLSILFMTFHLTDDIVRGMEPGTLRWKSREPADDEVCNSPECRAASRRPCPTTEDSFI